MRGRASEVWLQRFRRAWERRSGRSWRQLSPDESQALTAQAHSLHQVGFSTDRAAWMAVPRMGERGFAYPRMNPYRCGQDMRSEWADGTTWVELKCDICGKQHPARRARALDTRRFEDEGWVIARDNTAACPDCMKKRADELWRRRLSNPCGGHRRRRRNPDYSKIKGFEPWMAQNPQFCQAVDKFMEFHGVMPQSINKKSMPGMGRPDDVQFFVHMGKAMDTTYKPTHRGSKKYGSAYIHEFGEELGRKPKDADLPDQVCTPDGKNIVTFGGRFEVKDWVRK